MARSAAQKAATKKLVALNRARAKAARSGATSSRRTKRTAARRAKQKTIVAGKIGAKRKRGRVIGVLDRRPGHLYYVTGNGSIVETVCVRGGCRKKKSRVRVPGKARVAGAGVKYVKVRAA